MGEMADGSDIPRISMVYFFMSSKDEDATDDSVTGVIDEKTGETCARTTGANGPEE